jgi:hypothetical protein
LNGHLRCMPHRTPVHPTFNTSKKVPPLGPRTIHARSTTYAVI